MRAKVEAIIGHGINCFVNRQLIYNFPEEIFADAGVMAIEHADFDGIERLALVTGWFLQLSPTAVSSLGTHNVSPQQLLTLPDHHRCCKDILCALTQQQSSVCVTLCHKAGRPEGMLLQNAECRLRLPCMTG